MNQNSVESWDERLVSIRSLLSSALSTFVTLWEEGAFDPKGSPTSQSMRDSGAQIAKLEMSQYESIRDHPRSLAGKMIRQQAGLCYSLNYLLVDPANTWDAVNCVVRAIIELGSRALWVLDPLEDHRIRCIRASLIELVSLNELSKGAAIDPSDPRQLERKRDAKANFRKLRKRTEEIFPNCDFNGDFLKWSIDGEFYPRWTAAVDKLSQRVGLGVDGEALYNALSVTSHPQGFTATSGINIDESGLASRRVYIKDIENIARLSLGTYFACLRSFLNYHGSRAEVFDVWEHHLLEVFPDLFH